MPRVGLRFVAETLFILAVAVLAGTLSLVWWTIILMMFGAWLAVTLLEWRLAGRTSPRSAAVPAVEGAPVGASAPEATPAEPVRVPTHVRVLSPAPPAPATQEPPEVPEAAAAGEPSATTAPEAPEPEPVDRAAAMSTESLAPLPAEPPAVEPPAPPEPPAPESIEPPAPVPAEPIAPVPVAPVAVEPAAPAMPPEPQAEPAEAVRAPEPVTAAVPPLEQPPVLVDRIPAYERDRVVSIAPRLPAGPREWNLWELERLVREHESGDLAEAEERNFLLMYLREFADANGLLSVDFDDLVRDSFGELLGAPT